MDDEENLKTACVIFGQLQILFAKYLLLKRKNSRIRKLKKKKLALISTYCLGAYQTITYKRIMENDEDFIRKHLRVTYLILNKITDLLPNRSHGYTEKFRLSVFLYWLASGTSYRVTSIAFNISRYSVRDIVHGLLDFFVEICPKFIKYPEIEMYEKIGNNFNSRGDTKIFTKALGAIDGCHIKITVPKTVQHEYINKKLNYCCINFQGVSDSFGRFISICSGFSGSIEDQEMLQKSELYKKGIFPPNGYFLLGDNNYNCCMKPITIITPFKIAQPLTMDQKKFNRIHKKSKNIIEKTFRILKLRWKSIFNKTLELKIDNCVKTIVACCVMHNICFDNSSDIIFEDDLEEELLVDEEEDIEETGQTSDNDDDDAVRFRNQLMESME